MDFRDAAAFYDVQARRMECLGHDAVPFADVLCQMADLLGNDELRSQTVRGHAGNLTLTLDDVRAMTRFLVERAESWCGGRVVSALEGGYAPEQVAQAVLTHLEALA